MADGQNENIRDSVQKGRYHTQKLKADDVRAIRKELEAGMTGKSLAEKYGVTVSAISDLKRGKTWGWLA